MRPAGSNYRPNAGAALKATNTAGIAGAAYRPLAAGGGQAPSNAAARGAGGGGAPRADESRQYLAARVMTASPLDLILIMYEQLFKVIGDIRANIGRRSPAAVEPDSERAQAIIDELINALDFDVDMSKDLGAIYYYVRDRILEANIKFDASIWEEIEETMRPLYEGFSDAAGALAGSGVGGEGAGVGAPAIVAGMTYGHGKLNEVVVNTKNGLSA